MRTIIEQPLTAPGVDLAGFANGALEDEFAGPVPGRIEAALVGNGQFDFIASGGDQHLIALAQVGAHGFFA